MQRRGRGRKCSNDAPTEHVELHLVVKIGCAKLGGRSPPSNHASDSVVECIGQCDQIV